MTEPLRVALVSREYPPEVYGGAGVHIGYLARELARFVDLRVHAFGETREAREVAATYKPWGALSGGAPELDALRTLSVNLLMSAGLHDVDIVHSHTWYANMAGHFAKLLYGVPHVMTSHSLEPLRPWKREQLGGGYAISCFCEKTAIEAADCVIAVSTGMKKDILSCYPAVDSDKVVVLHNGVDPSEYRPVAETAALQHHGIDASRPYVVFVGRVTRQKGIIHLLEAAKYVEPGAQLVLCAGAPDTPELGVEVKKLVAELRQQRSGIHWIEQMMPRDELVQILSHARAFVCPSVYEPFGIVNLEAMSCEAPVVASAVGGIPEVVVDGETGFLVHYQSDGSPAGTPLDPDAYARALAERINVLVEDEALARRMGRAGRERVLRQFSWSKIAEQTKELYRRVRR